MSDVTLKWSVINMTRVVDDGFVIKVDWACSASSSNVKGAMYAGQTSYENDLNKGNFIPYDDLTEDIVLGWVYEDLGAEKTTIETTLTAKVEAKKNPVSATGVPW